MEPSPASGSAPGAAYGPNTPAVRRFLQRFAALAPREWDEAAAAFAELEGTRRFAAADRALAGVIERLDRGRERDAVVGPILQIARPTATAADGEPHPVVAAALAAALALIVRDALDERDFATLYAPFAALVWVDAL